MAVYFIRDAKLPEVKIGYSWSPEERLRTLRSEYRKELQLLKTVYGARAEEAAFHREFKEYRLHGEWFKLTGRLLRFIGRKRPRPKPKPMPIEELVREAINKMIAEGYTEQQMADTLHVSTGTIYNLLNTN